MNDSIQARVEEARAALEATEVRIAEVEEELRGAVSKVRSRDRSVEVTVGPRGELQRIRFLENRYRTMSEAQLASSVMEAVDGARSRMARRVMEAYTPLTDSLAGLPGMDPERIGLERFFGPPAGAADMGGSVSRAARSRLRDEIHEDGEPAAKGSGGKR
ncbi:YbaB/EbfC family nucleoid-associated protein [Streptomyces sp. NPDC088707]|uniref:YbaB/EbfC family nucleoid-associated protein n=1 Tax=Streptomyces sp. NPDC088707 TaxID=3365871 RepID=UPI00382178FC